MLSFSTKTLSGPGINDSVMDANKNDMSNSISIVYDFYCPTIAVISISIKQPKCNSRVGMIHLVGLCS